MLSARQIEKAKSLGFELREDDDKYSAEFGTMQVWGETAREAVELAKQAKIFMETYKWLKLELHPEEASYLIQLPGGEILEGEDLQELIAQALEEYPEPP